MNYYSFHIGDYASHTRHLSPIEDLAFRRLLDLYYMTEKPIIGDQAARLIGLREYGHDVMCVLMEFFTETSDGFINKRADDEIAAYKAKIEQSRNAGKASAKAKLSKRTADVQQEINDSSTTIQPEFNDRSTDVQPTNNHKPITNNQSKPTTPDGFAEFWLAYPKKVGKGAAESAWKKAKPPVEKCLAAIAVQKNSDQWKKDGGQFVPNPATWINQRRWEDGEAVTVANPAELITLPDGRQITRAQQDFLKRVMS